MLIFFVNLICLQSRVKKTYRNNKSKTLTHKLDKLKPTIKGQDSEPLEPEISLLAKVYIDPDMANFEGVETYEIGYEHLYDKTPWLSCRRMMVC